MFDWLVVPLGVPPMALMLNGEGEVQGVGGIDFVTVGEMEGEVEREGEGV